MRFLAPHRRLMLAMASLLIGAVTAPAAIANSASPAADRIQLEYTFLAPRITEIKSADQTFHRLTMPEAPCGGQIGQPALPACAARILLPPGTIVKHIEVTGEQSVELGTGYCLEPVDQPVPFSRQNQSTDSRLILDSLIYARTSPYPEALFREIGIYALRGYQILVLRLSPVQYTPAVGRVSYYPRLTVTVQLENTGWPGELYRGLPQDRRAVLEHIDNLAMIEMYPQVSVKSAGMYDLLIIAHPAWLGPSFLPLKQHHDAAGVPTEIRTAIDIGGYTPEMIRDYIRAEYLNNGIEYVLLVGDDDLLPARDLYVKSWEGFVHGDAPIYCYDLPSDLYFGCLDGSFNADGDALWGEPTDGEGGGDVDLLAEVYVGRAPVDDIAGADRFVNKTLAYANAEGPYLGRVVLAGEYLGYGGEVNYAAPYLDELVDSSQMHGYTTMGIPSNEYAIEKLYDLTWPNWPRAEIIARINNGSHLINHLGHSSHEYALKMTQADVAALTNDDFCFIYTQGCDAGAFDSAGCMAEYFTGDYEHGAFAVIMNARYGFGSSRTTELTTDSPSQRFNREFLDGVYNPAENKRELGRANQDSKEDNLYRIDEPAMRWCYYQLNLFGDPTIALKAVPCICNNYCDLDNSGGINPLDVAVIVNYVYRQRDSRVPLGPTCPGENGDWNGSGTVDPLDVSFYVNYVYRSRGDGPVNPCE